MRNSERKLLSFRKIIFFIKYNFYPPLALFQTLLGKF